MDQKELQGGQASDQAVEEVLQFQYNSPDNPEGVPEWLKILQVVQNVFEGGPASARGGRAGARSP